MNTTATMAGTPNPEAINPEKPSDFEEAMDRFHLAFSGPYPYIAFVICLVGLWLNFTTILILTRKEMRTPVNYITRVLVGVECICLLTYAPYLLMRIWEPKDSLPSTSQYKPVAIYYLVKADVTPICQMIIIWLTIVAAAFRAIYIMFPLKARILCSIQRALCIVVVVIVSTILVNVMNVYRNDIAFHVYENKTYYRVDQREELNDMVQLSQATYYIIVFVGKIIPCGVLILLTILLLKLLSTSRKSHERLSGKRSINHENSHANHEYHRTTALLLSLLIVFLIIELPNAVLVILTLVIEESEAMTYIILYINLQDVIELSLIIGYSFSFLLYCSTSKKFREIFVEICSKMIGSCWKGKKPFPSHDSNSTGHTHVTLTLEEHTPFVQNKPAMNIDATEKSRLT